jgi:predicted patatin/cPLA2 family phospholipase
MAARRYPKLRDGILRHYEIKGEALDYAENPPKGVTVHIIRPTHPTGLGRLSRDLEAIHAAIDQGRSDGHAFLGSVTAKTAA